MQVSVRAFTAVRGRPFVEELTLEISERLLSSVMREIKGHRGYYIAARGYEFYLLVLKVSLLSAREDNIRIPKRLCNVLFII